MASWIVADKLRAIPILPGLKRGAASEQIELPKKELKNSHNQPTAEKTQIQAF